MEQQRKLADYLNLKYADRKLDLIVCIASPSLSFLQQFGSATFLKAPRVAVLSETEYHILQRAGPTPVAATVLFGLHHLETLNLALALQPKTRQVIVVGGASQFDRLWIEQFRQEIPSFHVPVDFKFWPGLAVPVLLDRLKHLPSDAIVLYLTMVNDGAGQPFLESNVVSSICRASSVPVYGLRHSYLGLGIVGGNLTDLEVTGRAAGEIGARILQEGVSAGTLIRKAGTNRIEVDWRQMQRWHLPPKALPTHASIQFRTPSVWEIYGWKIAAIALLCGAETLLILGLLVHRSRHNLSEAALRQKSLELRSLAGQLITVQEEERQRIARELHDAFCQQIAVLALGINKIERSLTDVPFSVREQFTELENRLMTLSGELRQLSHELYPALLKYAGLAAALKRYCREFTALTGIEVALSIELSQRPVPPPVALCLYRIAQESLNNVAKYAGTDHARVNLVEREGEYQLTVEDKGAGFDPAQARQKYGIGLSSMEERIRLLNGRMVIQSQPKAGARVQAALPVDEQANTPAQSVSLAKEAL